MDMKSPAPKPKGTQPNHHVTETTPKKNSMGMPADRPMVGNDKEMHKKYGSKSWNNGYTN